MESISNCPRVGDACSLCVNLSKEEFAQELRAGGFDEPTTQNYSDDSKLAVFVEETGGIDMLSCDERRNRAKVIGRKAGEALVYRSKSPGDV